MKVLVVEDERAASQFLQQGLREEGYAVDAALTGHMAAELSAVYEYDIILLDIMLPGLDGFELCKRWRSAGIKTPVIFLTARDDLADRIRGLDLGGDDYLAKPYAFGELLSRMRALIRRSAANAAESKIRSGDLEIDLSSHRVKLYGREIFFTNREYQLLQYLALNAGKLVTRSQLWDHVWETGSEPDSNVIEVYIRYLRSKLGRDPDYIHTQRGSGYIFGMNPIDSE